MTPREISNQLNIPYVKALELLQAGTITAKKVKNRWNVTQEQFKTFKASNSRKIKGLQSEYVNLYWQGLTHYQIQNRVADDFRKRHIVATTRGFAESAICEALKERKDA